MAPPSSVPIPATTSKESKKRKGSPSAEQVAKKRKPALIEFDGDMPFERVFEPEWDLEATKDVVRNKLNLSKRARVEFQLDRVGKKPLPVTDELDFKAFRTRAVDMDNQLVLRYTLPPSNFSASASAPAEAAPAPVASSSNPFLQPRAPVSVAPSAPLASSFTSAAAALVAPRFSSEKKKKRVKNSKAVDLLQVVGTSATASKPKPVVVAPSAPKPAPLAQEPKMKKARISGVISSAPISSSSSVPVVAAVASSSKFSLPPHSVATPAAKKAPPTSALSSSKPTAACAPIPILKPTLGSARKPILDEKAEKARKTADKVERDRVAAAAKLEREAALKAQQEKMVAEAKQRKLEKRATKLAVKAAPAQQAKQGDAEKAAPPPAVAPTPMDVSSTVSATPVTRKAPTVAPAPPTASTSVVGLPPTAASVASNSKVVSNPAAKAAVTFETPGAIFIPGLGWFVPPSLRNLANKAGSVALSPAPKIASTLINTPTPRPAPADLAFASKTTSAANAIASSSKVLASSSKVPAVANLAVGAAIEDSPSRKFKRRLSTMEMKLETETPEQRIKRENKEAKEEKKRLKKEKTVAATSAAAPPLAFSPSSSTPVVKPAPLPASLKKVVAPPAPAPIIAVAKTVPIVTAEPVLTPKKKRRAKGKALLAVSAPASPVIVAAPLPSAPSTKRNALLTKSTVVAPFPSTSTAPGPPVASTSTLPLLLPARTRPQMIRSISMLSEAGSRDSGSDTGSIRSSKGGKKKKARKSESHDAKKRRLLEEREQKERRAVEEVEMGLAVPNDENQEEPVVENKEEIEKRRAEKGKGKAVEENVDMEETVETPETTESNEKVAEQSVKSDDNTTKFVYSDEEQDEGEDGDDEDDGEEEPATPVPVPVPAPASAPIVEEEEIDEILPTSSVRTRSSPISLSRLAPTPQRDSDESAEDSDDSIAPHSTTATKLDGTGSDVYQQTPGEGSSSDESESNSSDCDNALTPKKTTPRKVVPLLRSSSKLAPPPPVDSGSETEEEPVVASRPKVSIPILKSGSKQLPRSSLSRQILPDDDDESSSNDEVELSDVGDTEEENSTSRRQSSQYGRGQDYDSDDQEGITLPGTLPQSDDESVAGKEVNQMDVDDEVAEIPASPQAAAHSAEEEEVDDDDDEEEEDGDVTVIALGGEDVDDEDEDDIVSVQRRSPESSVIGDYASSTRPEQGSDGDSPSSRSDPLPSAEKNVRDDEATEDETVEEEKNVPTSYQPRASLTELDNFPASQPPATYTSAERAAQDANALDNPPSSQKTQDSPSSPPKKSATPKAVVEQTQLPSPSPEPETVDEPLVDGDASSDLTEVEAEKKELSPPPVASQSTRTTRSTRSTRSTQNSQSSKNPVPAKAKRASLARSVEPEATQSDATDTPVRTTRGRAKKDGLAPLPVATPLRSSGRLSRKASSQPQFASASQTEVEPLAKQQQEEEGEEVQVIEPMQVDEEVEVLEKGKGKDMKEAVPDDDHEVMVEVEAGESSLPIPNGNESIHDDDYPLFELASQSLPETQRDYDPFPSTQNVPQVASTQSAVSSLKSGQEDEAIHVEEVPPSPPSQESLSLPVLPPPLDLSSLPPSTNLRRTRPRMSASDFLDDPPTATSTPNRFPHLSLSQPAPSSAHRTPTTASNLYPSLPNSASSQQSRSGSGLKRTMSLRDMAEAAESGSFAVTGLQPVNGAANGQGRDTGSSSSSSWGKTIWNNLKGTLGSSQPSQGVGSAGPSSLSQLNAEGDSSSSEEDSSTEEEVDSSEEEKEVVKGVGKNRIAGGGKETSGRKKRRATGLGQFA